MYRYRNRIYLLSRYIYEYRNLKFIYNIYHYIIRKRKFNVLKLNLYICLNCQIGRFATGYSDCWLPITVILYCHSHNIVIIQTILCDLCLSPLSIAGIT